MRRPNAMDNPWLSAQGSIYGQTVVCPSLGVTGDCVAHFALNGQPNLAGQRQSCIRHTNAPWTGWYSTQKPSWVASVQRALLLSKWRTWIAVFFSFYPRDAMLARVIEIATCLSVCPCVRPSRAGIVSKRRKLASWFLHRLIAPRL